MQQSNAPLKLVLPFSNAGAKNTIPTASQIGIVAGAASLTDGFPPLTRTPLAGGGVPPSGLDMNGILFELSAINRWANAGAGYYYDSTFANDVNVGGYPKGATVLRTDATGYWMNTTDNNVTDPEAGGAGWVPFFQSGLTAVTMTNANVTLTANQAGKPLIVITGLLTANLNLVFPTYVAQWLVVNKTTGAFQITAKTAAGTGVIVAQNDNTLVYGDGTNINAGTGTIVQRIASAGGTSNAITATFSPAPTAFTNGVPYYVRAASANSTTTPTFTPNSGTLAAKTIVKGNNLPLVAGDIAGAGHWIELQYDLTLDKWVLLNPAFGVSTNNFIPRSMLAGCGMSTAGSSTTLTVAAGQVTDSTNAAILALLSATAKTTASWAVGTATGGLDTGTIANSTWYYWYLIRRPDTNVTDVIYSVSSSAPTLPANYTQYRYIGAAFTNGSGQWTSFTQMGREFYWSTPVLDFSGAGSATAALLTCSVPRGRKVKGFFNLNASVSAAAQNGIYISDPANADLAPSQSTNPLATMYLTNAFTGGQAPGGNGACWTNTSAQIRHRETTTGSCQIATLGWIDLADTDL